MKLIYKLERKFGKYAIPDLMKYVMGLTVVGALLGLVAPGFYYEYLMLDFSAVLHGQVWRLLTFIMYPRLNTSTLMMDILFLAIMVYLYYSIGRTLENVWGTFRFNLFIFSGIILTVLATLVYFIVTGSSFALTENGLTYANLEQVFQAVILAFAFLFPEAQFLVFFVVPVKAKWLGYLYIGFSLFMCAQDFMVGNYLGVLLFLVAFVNFIVFYMMTKSPTSRASFGHASRQKKNVRYRNTAQTSQQSTYDGPRHRCAICGRTEQDNPNLEFRYCSKCEGNYEYCSDHLYTHEHVHHN